MKKMRFPALAISVAAAIACRMAPTVAAYPGGPQVSLASDSGKAAEQHFERAVRFLKQENFQDAILQYEKVIQLFPGSQISQDAQYWIGQAYLRMGKYDEASGMFNKLIEKNPGSAIVPVSRLMLARVQQEKEDSKRKRQIAAAMAQSVIIDPATGAKFTKVKTLTGKSDVIDAPNQLMLSPNGKFLLFHCIVIPLDGSAPFDLVDMPALRGSWSPDGKKVAFYSGKAIWIVPVNPETGRTSGPPTKLLDGKYQYDPSVSWSPDSDRIAFTRRDEKTTGDIWTLSIKDGTLHQVTDDPKPESYPRWSPDGKSIAYHCGNEIRLVAPGAGKPRKIIDLGILLSWTPDGEYLFCRDPRPGGFYLFRLADERVFDVDPPAGVGGFLAWSQDGKKMLFFSSSYEYSVTLRVVSSSGGPTFELGRKLKLWPHIQFWTRDNNIITKGAGDPTYWMIPLAGGEALPIKLDLSLDGKLHPSHFSLSPDRKNALLFKQRDDGKEDILIVPVSLAEARATGPATLVLEGWDRNRARTEYSWSPDGKELALIHEGHVWIASPGKGKPVQITKIPESPTYPVYSPAGGSIAFISEKELGNLRLKVIPSSGGEPATVLDHCGYWRYAWSPDGRKLAVYSKGVISLIPMPGGKPEPVFELKSEGLVENAWGLFWLPDGKRIGFISQRERDKPTRIYLIPATGGKATELATDNDGYMNLLYPSPDGKWISYDSEGSVKTRPESSIWEVNLSDLLKETRNARLPGAAALVLAWNLWKFSFRAW